MKSRRSDKCRPKSDQPDQQQLQNRKVSLLSIELRLEYSNLRRREREGD